MRRWVAACLLLSFLLPVPVSAQEDGTLRVLEDPTGDYYAELKDGPGIDDPTGHYGFMDLEWLDVQEVPMGFLFTLKVVDMTVELDDTIGFSDGGYHKVHFRHNDWDFELNIERPSGQFEITYWARLAGKFHDSEDWGEIWTDFDAPVVDLSANTVQVFVDREDLADSRGAAPYPGRELSDFWVWSSQRSSDARADVQDQALELPYRLGDRMPDQDLGVVSVPVQYGIQQTGHATLSSDEPFRASNGEATTFLYTVNATNTGDRPDVFGLEAVGVPSVWNVQLPLSAISLEAGESVAVPVLLTTPFGHRHGGVDTFLLEMTSTTDPGTVGRIGLGVRYLAVPMPAGHHDTVFFHSTAFEQTLSVNSGFNALFGSSGTTYMNTDSEDPTDQATPVTASCSFSTPTVFCTWLLPLDPTLRMGLDFDLDRIGEAVFGIQSPSPMQAPTVTGTLLLTRAQSGSTFSGDFDHPYLFGYNLTELATFETPAADFSFGSEQSFQVDVTPLEAADYVPYDPANNLVMEIVLEGTGVETFNQQTTPSLQPGGWMRLPLLEYEDDISDAFAALTGPSITTAVAARDANPGDLIVFDLDLAVPASAEGRYGLELTGQNTDWAFVTPGRLDLGTGTATVVVEVPDDARDGERADLFLQAVHDKDPQRRGLVRLVVDVDTDEEHDDDRLAFEGVHGTEAESTPLLAPVWILVALFWVSRHQK